MDHCAEFVTIKVILLPDELFIFFDASSSNPFLNEKNRSWGVEHNCDTDEQKYGEQENENDEGNPKIHKALE